MGYGTVHCIKLGQAWSNIVSTHTKQADLADQPFFFFFLTSSNVVLNLKGINIFTTFSLNLLYEILTTKDSLNNKKKVSYIKEYELNFFSNDILRLNLN